MSKVEGEDVINHKTCPNMVELCSKNTLTYLSLCTWDSLKDFAVPVSYHLCVGVKRGTYSRLIIGSPLLHQDSNQCFFFFGWKFCLYMYVSNFKIKKYQYFIVINHHGQLILDILINSFESQADNNTPFRYINKYESNNWWK